MQLPTIPANEAERIAALHAIRMLDTDPEEMFDRITRLAKQILNTPIALISLIDNDRQWFKARGGIELPETARDISFCAHGLISDEPLIVSDALQDARFADNPLVVGKPYIRFYAGVPLYSVDRLKIGMLCVIDSVPRSISAEQLQALQDLARSAEELMQQKQLMGIASSLLQALRDHELRQHASHEVQRQVEQLVMYDMLTGLPNRTMLITHIHRESARWQETGKSAVIACIDLDHFKEMNESFGQAAGDQALTTIAQRLPDALRQHDIVARINGDEFVILIDSLENEDLARSILRRVAEYIGRPIQISGQEISLSCSIGFSRYPMDGHDPDTLLNTANTAMRHAKQCGGGQIQRYSAELLKPAKHRLTVESQLRKALERNELSLHYQPKVELLHGHVVGVEALVRWRHPELGMISPAEFIPIAEDTGLIVPIGEWILHTACQQIRTWEGHGIIPVPVAVNLSSRQFMQSSLASRVEAILHSTGIAHGYLELELTESASMDNPEKSAEIMQKLKEMGVCLSIDDFGTGYSSLSYLKRLPIDKIKIDRSFVSDMNQSEEALAIVQAIIAMAHRLHLKVVAEGVETAQQLLTLTRNQCDEMQGFYFSKPLPADDCAMLLSSGRGLSASDYLRPGFAIAGNIQLIS